MTFRDGPSPKWLTYGALADRAHGLAQTLARAGVGAETRVGVCMAPSLELAICLPAILLTGSAYVPLDPNAPAARNRLIVGDAELALVISDNPHRDTPALGSVRVLAPDFTASQARPTGARVEPARAAYVIYTSGSSGQPKGVLVPHAAVDRLFSATGPWFAFAETDTWVLFHSIAFDFSVWEFWGALAHGGRLVIPNFLTTRDAARFHGLIREERVTILNQTPSAFRQFIEVDQAFHGTLPLRTVIFRRRGAGPDHARRVGAASSRNPDDQYVRHHRDDGPCDLSAPRLG